MDVDQKVLKNELEQSKIFLTLSHISRK